MEREYHKDFDLGFTTAMGCSLLLLILGAALQVTALPRTLILQLLHLRMPATGSRVLNNIKLAQHYRRNGLMLELELVVE